MLHSISVGPSHFDDNDEDDLTRTSSLLYALEGGEWRLLRPTSPLTPKRNRYELAHLSIGQSFGPVSLKSISLRIEEPIQNYRLATITCSHGQQPQLTISF